MSQETSVPLATIRREQIASYVEDVCRVDGWPPSIREICAAVGLQSTSTVVYHLENLVAAGRLKKVGSVRSHVRYVPTRDGSCWACGFTCPACYKDSGDVDR
ncbi:MAG: hypothetical protein WC718_19255 [Phycisphaerales bacterium]|jgi:SOS-response transcriptional repressor LexA